MLLFKGILYSPRADLSVCKPSDQVGRCLVRVSGVRCMTAGTGGDTEDLGNLCSSQGKGVHPHEAVGDGPAAGTPASLVRDPAGIPGSWFVSCDLGSEPADVRSCSLDPTPGLTLVYLKSRPVDATFSLTSSKLLCHFQESGNVGVS